MASSVNILRSILSHWFDREATAVLLFFLVALLVLFLITERISKMHPKYPPGPMGLPLVGSLPFLGAEPHKAMVELSKKYGNIFSLYLGTKYCVVLNDFDTMQDGLGHAAALDRAPNLFDQITGGLGFEELNGPAWKEQRRFCMNSMKDLGLGRGAWESLINEEISFFTKELEELEGEPTDISPMLSSSVSRNILSLLIGRTLDKEKEKHIGNLFYEFARVAFKNMGPANAAVLIPGFRRLMAFLKLAGYEAAPFITTKVNRFLRGEIQRNKSSKETRGQNFIGMYLEQMDAKEKRQEEKTFYALSEKVLEGNLNILFLGSSDTIFNSLMFMFRLMAAHRDIQNKIHEELDSVLGRDGRATSYEDHRKTFYTFAALLEMERYATIVPLSTTRLVNRDYELGGYIIPKGAQIFGNIWAVHYNPKYWKEPEKYLPERFLTEDRSKLLPKLPKGYAPFSLGKRNCPGEKVAMMEIYLYFCAVMQKFSISGPPGEELNFKVINGLVVQLESQKLRFSPKE